MIFYLNQLSSENIIPFILAFIISLSLAMTIHEYMHARVAYAFGDNTASFSGRLTLNPLAHIDPFGLFCFIMLGYGWATPVPVNPMKFKKYRLGMFFVSIAGVIANIVLAFIFSGIYFYLVQNEWFWQLLEKSYMLFAFLSFFFSISITMNLSLFFFNLIPIPPLDGFNMIDSIASANNKFINFVKQYGFQIFLGYLVITNILKIDLISYLVDYVELAFTNFWNTIYF